MVGRYEQFENFLNKKNCFNINIIWNSEIQILDGHKKKTTHYGLSTFN